MNQFRRRWYQSKLNFMFGHASMVAQYRKIDTSHIKWLLIQEQSRS